MPHNNTNGRRTVAFQAARRSIEHQSRLVDFLDQQKTDREAVLLGAFGFSTSYIESKTKLSSGQVGYRLKKAGIKRVEFRNGSSRFAKLVLRQVRDEADAMLIRKLQTDGVLYAHAA